MNNTDFNTKGSFSMDAAGGLDSKTLMAVITGKVAESKNNPAEGWEVNEGTKAPPKKAEPLTLSKLQLAEIVESQVRKHMDRFKAAYNKANTAGYVDYRIVQNSRPNGERGTVQVLEISIIKNGKSFLLYKTAYAFAHPAQMENEGEWKLTLWNEALYNLIGGGISYGLMLDQAREDATEVFTK